MINFQNKIVLNSIGEKAENDKKAIYSDLASGKKWIKNFMEVMPCNIQRVSMMRYQPEVDAIIKISADCIISEAENLKNVPVKGDTIRVCFRIAPDGFPAAPYDAPLSYTYQDKLMVEFGYDTDAAAMADNLRNALKSAMRIEDIRLPKLAEDDEAGKPIVILSLEPEMACTGLIVETVEKDWQDYPQLICKNTEATLADATADPTTSAEFSKHVKEFGGFNSLSQVVFPTASNTAWGDDRSDVKPVAGMKYAQILVTCNYEKQGYGYDAIGGHVFGQYTKEIWVNDEEAETLYTWIVDGTSALTEEPKALPEASDTYEDIKTVTRGTDKKQFQVSSNPDQDEFEGVRDNANV